MTRPIPHVAHAERYAIVLFPTFDASEQIEAVRRQFDPLAAILAAHVTLVFPFDETHSASSLHDFTTDSTPDCSRRTCRGRMHTSRT